MTKEIAHTLNRSVTPSGLKESDEDVVRGYSGVKGAEPFPPEPFRYVGGNIVRHVIHRMDRLQDQGRKPDAVTRTLARLAPPGALPPRKE